MISIEELTARYQEYRPGASLEPFAECVWTVESAQAIERYPILPDACLDIVFSPEFGVRAVGTMTACRPIALPAGARVVGVRFRPGLAGAFLRVAPRELTDLWTPLEDCWGAAARRLAERLEETSSAGARLVRLCGTLRVPENGRTPVGRAVAALTAAEGIADLDAVARHANLSARQFRRRCLEETGLTPKHLCRVLRFRRALRLLHHGLRGGWARLAAECGYYDQAHLIRDFREFSGRTPGEYLAAHNLRPPVSPGPPVPAVAPV